MIDVIKYKEWLEGNYHNEKTKKQYLDGVKRFNKLNVDFNKEGVYHYLARYKNNALNRAIMKSICECLETSIKIPVPKGAGTKRIYKFIEKEDVEKIINGTDLKTSLIVRLMFDCGLRLSEAINLERKFIDVENRVVKGVGKRNKEFEEPFSKKTCGYLVQYLDIIEGEYPFHYEGIKHHDKKFWRTLKTQCENIGLLNIHPHRIRHSLGHYLRTKMKWDLEQIREKLRHEDIKTTQIYARATKEEVDKKIKLEVFKDE